MILGWHAEVELLTPDAPPSLRIVRTRMTLRQAFERLLALPRDLQDRTGISLHGPVRLMAGRRPALQGFLTAAAVRELVGEYNFTVGQPRRLP